MTVPSLGATLKRCAAAALLPAPEPRVDVVAAAGRRADDHRDLLALVELRG